MRSEAVTCDICGRAKQETNHWFVAICRHGIISICPTWATAFYAAITESPDERQDLCGEDCLHKWLSAHLPELKETNAKNKPAK